MAKITEENKKIIKQIVSRWSEEKSLTRACEELNELSVDLLKLLRCDSTTEHDMRMRNIKYEMADVRIVLEHLEIRFGSYQENLDEKLKRLNMRGD